MPFLDDQAGLVFSDIARLISVGDVIMNINPTPRPGFLLCDWSLLDETAYPELFAAIGTAFNIPGDPVGFFRIPPSGGLSPMGAGSTPGYTTRALGDILGEENHVLTVSELASHTHLQNPHTHVQNAHNHIVTDPGHTHVQDAHTHVQNAHTHVQNAHTHTQDAHSHRPVNEPVIQSYAFAGSASIFTAAWGPAATINNAPNTSSTVATNQNTTATNQNATATNQSEVAVNQSATTDLTLDPETATNQNSTAVNDPEGGDVGHNTIHPVVCWYFFIRYV